MAVSLLEPRLDEEKDNPVDCKSFAASVTDELVRRCGSLNLEGTILSVAAIGVSDLEDLPVLREDDFNF